METENKEILTELRKKYGENVETRTGEVRAAGEDAPRVIEGYAAVFNVVTDIGSFREVIDPGAFEGRLADDVRLLFNHEGQPLARTTNGSLTLTTDETGLKYRAELADTTAGRDLYELIKRGDVSQSSFAFTIEKEERQEDGIRRVKKVRQLLDCACVTYAAYPTASVVTSRNIEPEEKPNATAPIEKRKEMETTTNLTLNDLKAKRAQVSDELAALTAGIETENRTAHSAETEQLEKYTGELEKLDGFIKMRDMKNQATARMAQIGTTSTSETSEFNAVAKQFSLSRAISSVSNGRNLLGAELEFSQECQNEMRHAGVQMRGQVGIPAKLMTRTADDFLAGADGAGNGGGFVPTISGPAITGLHAPSLMERLGVQMIQANGNLEFPRVSSNAVAGVSTEIATATASTLNLDTLTLTPQRVNNTTTYSKQLLLQGGSQVDALITNELVQGINTQIDIASFLVLTADADAGSPTVNIDATNTAITYAILNNLESLCLADGANLEGFAYAVSPGVFNTMRTLVGVDGITVAMDGMMVNGYRVFPTPNISGTRVVAGNFGQGLIGAKFGGLDILVDPFTGAGTAQTKLYCTQFWDAGIRQGGAMAVTTALT